MIAPQPGTPLPWTLADHSEYDHPYVQIFGNGDDSVTYRYNPAKVQVSDFAYIVHAANNFPKAQALADALRALRDFGCPVCSGDCGSANPPVTNCPMAAASAALTDWEGK